MTTRLITFFTALLIGSSSLLAQPFSFIQISDPQLGFSVGNDNIEPDIELLEATVAHINRLKPDFVLVTGDMVNSSKSKTQWAEYKRIIAQVDKSIPVYHLPGNHDTGKAGDEHIKHVEAYKSIMGEDHFSFTYNGCLFVGINSSIIRDDNSILEPEQFAWLKKALKKKAKMKFVFTHCPVFKKSFDEKEDHSNFTFSYREKYWSLFKASKVDVVGAGHVHYDRVASHDGIDMICCGPVTRPLGKGRSGFAIWKVDPKSGTYTCQFLSFEEIPQSID